MQNRHKRKRGVLGQGLGPMTNSNMSTNIFSLLIQRENMDFYFDMSLSDSYPARLCCHTSACNHPGTFTQHLYVG